MNYQIRFGIYGFAADFANVGIILSIHGKYDVSVDPGSNERWLILEIKEHTTEFVHTFIDSFSCPPEAVCPAIVIPPFDTAALDWSLFNAEEKPLSKLFSSPLLTADVDTPVTYTWETFTLEGTPAGSTLRLYTDGREDLVLRQ